MAEINTRNPELEMLRLNKQSGYNYREPRQADWLENYTLYRDKVKVNRLTQRQSVNIPLMKQTVTTLLKDVDDLPLLVFENLDNNKDAEIFQNEYWKWTGEQNRFELQDIVDKKQMFLFGRSFDQWQIIDGKIKMTVLDPHDMLVSRYTDPIDLNTSRFLIHTHIFEPLSKIEKNEMYDKAAIRRIKEFYATKQGLMKAKSNEEMLIAKNQKLRDMGISDIDDPVLGETYVELTLHFVYRDNEKGYDEQLFLFVEADDMEILMKKPLEEVIGTTKNNYWQNHYPYNSWADDVERQAFWSDAKADVIRTPNKVLNSFFSQLIENRTLRNYGMYFYDSTKEGFNPSTNKPVPFGQYGVPGNPKDVMFPIQIPDLSESLDEMEFIIGMVEKATGATPTQQGAQTDRQVTLGEVQLALGEAKERIKGMSKFYTPAWKRRGEIFLKLIEAAPEKIDAVKLYKKGRNTDNVYMREIAPKDWMTDAGYSTKVWSQDEKTTQDTDAIQKMNLAKASMPFNIKLTEVYNRKLLEFADLTPDEINDIVEFEQENPTMVIQQQQAQQEQQQEQQQNVQ